MTDDYSAWLGREEIQTDTLEPARTNALRAVLGEGAPRVAGDPLPALHHWLYFWNVQPSAALGPDGHPAKGGFLPPIPLPRRMWAGGRVRFLKPLFIGETVTRTSTILKIEAKHGKSGALVFVTVQHRFSGNDGLAVVEEQDLVYREPATTTASGPAHDSPVPDAPWRDDIFPDPVLLFRYSALTMNSHRIHYDQPYATGEEAYPGLVVHGPLQATLLATFAARRLNAPVTGFEFRSEGPAFAGAKLHIRGEPDGTGARVWTAQGGSRCMIATATCD
jgi:3-methylfumaryl-CoA hydratase